MTRDEMVQAMERDHADLLAALQNLSREALTTRPVIEAWTVKDLLGHMAMWQQVAIQFVADYRQEGLPKSLGLADDAAIDAYNRRGAELRRDWPLERVQAELDASYRSLLASVKSLTDDELHAPLGGPWENKTTLEHLIAINSYDHDPEHIAQIRRLGIGE